MEVATEAARQLMHVAAMPRFGHHNGTHPGHEAPNIPFGTVEFWIVAFVCLLLVAFAALMSGLTMAYMSFDTLNLSILEASGTVVEKTYAAAITPLLANRHLLLVTLLVGNATAMEALPIFLDKLVPSEVAIILSVSFVLIFGEVIPQALFTKYRLQIGAYLALYMRWQQIVTWPICFPIAKMLDVLLGSKHATVYRRTELKELARMHVMDGSGQGTLTESEVRVMVGTLELAEKRVENAMIPIDNVKMLSMDQVLDGATLAEIFAWGKSRIPVFLRDPCHVVGFLIVKNLIIVSHEDAMRVRDVANICLRGLTRVRAGMPLFDLLKVFQKEKTHMALVVEASDNDPERMPHLLSAEHKNVGLITMEDIIEEILQQEIEDETDADGVGDVMQNMATQYMQERMERSSSGERKGSSRGSLWGGLGLDSPSPAKRGRGGGGEGSPADAAAGGRGGGGDRGGDREREREREREGRSAPLLQRQRSEPVESLARRSPESTRPMPSGGRGFEPWASPPKTPGGERGRTAALRTPKEWAGYTKL